VALRADTARHIITGVTVLVFSAAAIGTAMRYQDRGPITDLPAAAEVPAREPLAAANPATAGRPTYTDAARSSGADIAAKLDGTVAHGGSGMFLTRQGNGAGSMGTSKWWGNPSAQLTPTAGRRSGGGGSVSMPGGYAVSGGARADRSGSNRSGGGSNNNRPGSGGGGGGSDPVFGGHNPSVGDLLNDQVAGLDGVGTPGSKAPGGLSHTPEPTSLLLMATGVAGVLAAARRRRKAQHVRG
jgi:hypothetical protein